MKLSSIDSLLSIVADITLASSLYKAEHSHDTNMTTEVSTKQNETRGKSFLKINPHVKPVGINFANISARNYLVLKNLQVHFTLK